MKNIKILPVIPFVEGEYPKKRVAAYCRISTELEEQHKSLEAQLAYYSEKIKNNPEWIFATD